MKMVLIYGYYKNLSKFGNMYGNTGLDKKNQRKIVNIFLPIIFSICLGCSKEYPQHMFWMRNKKIIFLLRTLN